MVRVMEQEGLKFTFTDCQVRLPAFTWCADLSRSKLSPRGKLLQSKPSPFEVICPPPNPFPPSEGSRACMHAHTHTHTHNTHTHIHTHTCTHTYIHTQTSHSLRTHSWSQNIFRLRKSKLAVNLKAIQHKGVGSKIGVVRPGGCEVNEKICCAVR